MPSLNLLDQIALPDSTTYDLKDYHKSGIYTVIGTQTAATASWTGELHGVSALYDGLTINYYLPYAGVSSTNVTLNLTLDSGSTTGAKNCYINTSRLTTHYGAGRTIVMTYYSAGSISISGTATTDDRWICDAYYDTNSDTKVRQTLSTTNKNYPLLLSYAESSSTTTNVDNVSYRNNSIFANPSTGKITATNISVAPPADNATFPTGGYIAHDVRNVVDVPTTQGVNFIMTNEGTGISNSWYSGIYCKSSGGEYGAWELVGCALNADNRTKPFYVRNSNKTTAWGDWRKVYDSANPPTANETGAWDIATLGIALASGDNVDTLEVGKTYYSADSARSQSLTGTPPTTSAGFKLIAYQNYGSTGKYDFQFATSTNGNCYIRYCNGTANSWGDWYKIYNSGNLTSQSASSGGTDVSLVTTGEKYTWNNKADTDTKNTAGATDTSSKIYLIGATSQDANPQTYSDNQVYVTSGILQSNIVSATAGVNANTGNNGNTGGLSLYSTNFDNYSITMRKTGTATGELGKHGYVQGDWAIFFNMNTTSNSQQRGWIFRHARTEENIASMDIDGNMVLNGSVTIGGNATNTSGARMEYNTTTQAIDFVFT